MRPVFLAALLAVQYGAAFSAEPKEVIPAKDSFPATVALGEVLRLAPPAGIDEGQPRDFLRRSCADGSAEATVHVLLLPKTFCPNYLVLPALLEKLPADGRLPPGWKQAWRAAWVSGGQGEPFKTKSEFTFELTAQKGAAIPLKRMALVRGRENKPLTVNCGELFLLENPDGAWAACYPPPGGEISAGKFEPHFRGFMLVGFFRAGRSTFHYDQGGSEMPFGAFEVKAAPQQ